jgi:hypothetical protein
MNRPVQMRGTGTGGTGMHKHANRMIEQASGLDLGWETYEQRMEDLRGGYQQRGKDRVGMNAQVVYIGCPQTNRR